MQSQLYTLNKKDPYQTLSRLSYVISTITILMITISLSRNIHDKEERCDLYCNAVAMKLIAMMSLSVEVQGYSQWCCSSNVCLHDAVKMMISAIWRRGLEAWSWSGSVSQGSWSWCLSIGISIRIILCRFSSPRGRSFGPSGIPTYCVLVSLLW